MSIYTSFFYLLRSGSSVWANMFLLWSSCTKEKRVAPQSSLMPMLLSPPGAIQEVIRSECLVRQSIKNDLPCKSVNRKEHMNVYWQLQCKACWLWLSSPLAAMQAMVGDCALVSLVSLLQICREGVDGWGISAVLTHHPPCSGHSQQNARALETRFKTIKYLSTSNYKHTQMHVQAKIFLCCIWGTQLRRSLKLLAITEPWENHSTELTLLGLQKYSRHSILEWSGKSWIKQVMKF